MDQNNQAKKTNPLSQWFRQPKIFVKLPSQGDFYPQGSLDKSSTGEYPVYAMTAKDELMFKTPDALLSGQSTVEVIKSCIPSIQDPWQMPSLDIDAALIAIRVATYGENMGVEANCPYCGEENDYDINLVNWLERINAWRFVPEVKFEPLTIHVRPYTYRELSQTSLKTLEHQRIFNVINNEELSDEQKIERFGQSFVKLTSLTVDIIAGCVSKISTPDGDVTDPAFIKEYISNAPKDVFEKISNHVTEMKQNIELPVQHVACNSCNKEFDMPVTMDQSNFFGLRILSSSVSEILEHSKRLDNEAREIKKEALKICWYMRGMSYSEAMNLSYEERSIVGEIIKDNLETTKKSGLPFF